MTESLKLAWLALSKARSSKEAANRQGESTFRLVGDHAYFRQ
jgi:predicted N-acetyltransferase YhbS